MRKKTISLILLIFSNIVLAEISEIGLETLEKKIDVESIVKKLEGSPNKKNVIKISEIKSRKKDKFLQEQHGIPIKVKLSYTNPKIEIRNGKYYVNGNPYRGVVYQNNGNVINEVGLEDYLYSVVSAEMPVYFGAEALKAQSVAARTYAINTIKDNQNEGFDIFDTDLSQVYHGMKNEKKQCIDAVNATKGEVIIYKGEPILALYHSSSGDKTKSAKEIFNKEVPYLKSVEDFSNSKKWEYKISRKELEKKFRKSYDKIPYLNKNKIRRKLTSKNIPSTNFKMKQIGKEIYIRGKGYGHGVGMSQWGAKYLGQVKKYKYQRILKHYYKGVKIEKLSNIK